MPRLSFFGPHGASSGRKNLPLTNGGEMLVYLTVYKNIVKLRNVINKNHTNK